MWYNIFKMVKLRKVTSLALVGSILFLSNPLALSADNLSLRPLIKEALNNNPELTAYRKKWEASKARIPQAKAWEDPVVGLEFEKIPKGLRVDLTMPEDRMLSLAQIIPFFGKLPLKGKIAFFESQMIASEYKAKEIEVINMIKQAYFELFLNYKEIELNQESLKLLDGIARVGETNYAVGKITQEEVLKIHSEIARLDNTIRNLKQENLVIQARINTTLNRQAEQELGVPSINEETNLNLDTNTLYRLTLENKPELLVFSYAIERNKHAKALAKRSVFPDIMAEIVLRGITSGAGIGPWDIMLAVSVPIWYWTKQRYAIKEAIYSLEEAEAAYKAMENKALLETKDIYTKTNISLGKIRLSRDTLIPLSESSLAASLSGYRAGEFEFMMLIDNLRMLIDTKMEYYRNLADFNMNLADLERQVGLDYEKILKFSEVKNEK